MLAGSGVTVLSADQNTNTWEATDFAVALTGVGAAGAGAGGGKAGGGKGKGGGGKGGAAMPWFLQAAGEVKVRGRWASRKAGVAFWYLYPAFR